MSRLLLEPSNNTLSHIAKCLALRELLETRGHEVFLATSAVHAAFLKNLGEDRYFILPDLQDADKEPSPVFSWFRPKRIEMCVRAEAALIKQLHPDIVLGVFRFTGSLSATLASVPYHSLICGAMTPVCPDILGFAADEPGAIEQNTALRFFRKTCADRIRPALYALGLDAVDDIWQLLVGCKTFLWDFPEFQPLPPAVDYFHVGPIHWSGWQRFEVDCEALNCLEKPIAYVAFGTGQVCPNVISHLVETLLHMGYSVALALGGQQPPAMKRRVSRTRLAVFKFLSSDQILAKASVMVCHGGQGLIFEAMRQHVPIFILPLQPEQAQNGVCVERMGCGRRLHRGVVFAGHQANAETALLERSIRQLSQEMAYFLDDKCLPEHLTHAAGHINRYQGAETLATLLEATTS